MPVYHNMQNQENLMTQTQENDQKPQIWANLGLICPILGQKFFFEKWGDEGGMETMETNPPPIKTPK